MSRQGLEPHQQGLEPHQQGLEPHQQGGAPFTPYGQQRRSDVQHQSSHVYQSTSPPAYGQQSYGQQSSYGLQQQSGQVFQPWGPFGGYLGNVPQYGAITMPQASIPVAFLPGFRQLQADAQARPRPPVPRRADPRPCHRAPSQGRKILHHDFKRHGRDAKRFFIVGRVLSAPIPEPSGDDKPSDWTIPDIFGQLLHNKPRRFVVIGEGQDHCTALPIVSYQQQGTGKEGVEKWQYAIIHTTPVPPLPMETESPQLGERSMLSPPILVEPRSNHNDFQLLPTSRLCFGRPQTIEHNIRVRNLGMVSVESLAMLRRHYGDVCACKSGNGLGVSLPHKVADLGSIAQAVGLNASTSIGDLRESSAPENTVSFAQDVEKMSASSPAQLTAIDEVTSSRVYKIISGTPGEIEESDSRFYRRPSKWFKPGKVIQLLTGEETLVGSNWDDEPAVTDVVIRRSPVGAPELQQPRWFLITAAGESSCFGLRIMTYQGQGLSGLPKELSSSDHSIIFTGKQSPGLTASEHAACAGPLGQPVRIKERDRAQPLDPLARLLWTRTYEIKYDVKAHTFGEVHKSCKDIVGLQYDLKSADCSIDCIDPGRANISGAATNAGKTQGAEPGLSTGKVGRSTGQQSTPRQFSDGEAVMLLTAKTVADFMPPHRLLRVGVGRYVFGEMRWEYSLKHMGHDGRFAGGQYFKECVLMRQYCKVV
ncbi:hypothetical protein LTR85_002335 [Meristemomyces frigidus]|nr:hypothetical protein LTR85_002335 [Meristemomyces frigidus]